MESPVGEWELCGDRFYAVNDLYTMAWEGVDLEYVRVACAPFGGPLATIRDDSKPVPLGATGSVSTAAPAVRVYSAAGAPLAAFPWTRGRVVSMGWSDNLDLLILEDSGEVHSHGILGVRLRRSLLLGASAKERLANPECKWIENLPLNVQQVNMFRDVATQVHTYSMFGVRSPRHFSLGAAAKQEGVSEGHIYGDGIVALTAAGSMWAVTGIASGGEPRPQRLPPLPLGAQTGRSHSWALLPPPKSPSGCLEVLVAAGDSLWVVDADSAVQQSISAGPLLRLAVSPDCRFVAAYCQSGGVAVWTADFSRALSSYDSGRPGAAPEHFAWCGSDSLVAVWQGEETVTIIGPLGDTAEIPVSGPVRLASELDGVRIVSNERHALLRRVPEPLVEIFRVGSTAPGAVLYDARELFDAQNPRADGLLRSIAAELPAAVATCAAAAAAELDPLRQSALLKAACYGRAFVPAGAFPRDGIVSVVRRLRVLNTMRDPAVGVPLTAVQLERLGFDGAMARLVAARHHLLAVRICQQLGLSPAKVLVEWAKAKISASGGVPDAELRDVLRAKLAPAGRRVRYAAIAAHAQSLGRPGLATLLLEHETRAAEQVPLLLELKEGDRALDAALAAGDPDLIHLALFAAFRGRPLPDFLAVLATRPTARVLFERYCDSQEPELLEQLFTSTGRLDRVADGKLRKAIDIGGGAGAAAGSVTATVKTLERAAELYSQSKDHGFQAKATAEFAKLRRVQAELEVESGQLAFVGLSVHATIRQALRLGNDRAAHRIRAEFKVSDRRFADIKIRTLAAEQQWEALDALSRDRKHPGALDTFISAARANDAPAGVVTRFIARLPSGKAKAEQYAAAGMYAEAAEAAAAAKDGELLGRIQAAVGVGSPLSGAISGLRDRLQLPAMPSMPAGFSIPSIGGGSSGSR